MAVESGFQDIVEVLLVGNASLSAREKVTIFFLNIFSVLVKRVVQIFVDFKRKTFIKCLDVGKYFE